jgi:uncharacterized protein
MTDLLPSVKTPDPPRTFTIENASGLRSLLEEKTAPNGATVRLPRLPETDGKILSWFQRLAERGYRSFETPFVPDGEWDRKKLKGLSKNLHRFFRKYVELRGSIRDLRVRELDEALAVKADAESVPREDERLAAHDRELKKLADFYRPAFRRASMKSRRSRIFLPMYNESLPLIGHIDPEAVKFGTPRRGLPHDWRSRQTFLQWKDLALSPFTFFYDFGKYTALYHSLFVRKIYGDSLLGKIHESFRTGQPLDDDEAESYLPLLQEEGYLVPRMSDPLAPLQAARKNFALENPHISILYLLVTNNCNLSCAYCNIESERRKPPGFAFSYMTEEIARRAIELFIRTRNDRNEPTVIFYGGEPLLNWTVMEYAVRYLRRREEEGAFGGKQLRIQMVSNGTLINPDIVKVLKETRVSPGISIDGMRSHHDRGRPAREGRGSWDDSVRGYLMCQRAGLSPGISCTLGNHNMPEIREIAEYFSTELEIRGMGFNIQKGLPADHPSLVCPGLATEKIIEAFRVFRRYGINEDRIMRKIKAFMGEALWIHDCAGYGGQLTVSPQGWIGPCHIFTEDGQFLIGDMLDPGIEEKVREGEVLRTWCRRSPLMMQECHSCEGLGICGGGCALEAQVRKGDLFAMDEAFCLHCKTALKWMLEELGDSLLERKLLTC